MNNYENIRSFEVVSCWVPTVQYKAKIRKELLGMQLFFKNKIKSTLDSNTGRQINHYVQLQILYIHIFAEMHTVKKTTL